MENVLNGGPIREVHLDESSGSYAGLLTSANDLDARRLLASLGNLYIIITNGTNESSLENSFLDRWKHYLLFVVPKALLSSYHPLQLLNVVLPLYRMDTKRSKLSKRTRQDVLLANRNLNPPNSKNGFTLVSMFFPQVCFHKNW